MIPEEEGSVNQLINETRISQSVLISETSQNNRVLAHAELSRFLKESAGNLTEEEMQQLMIKAYQGCDLKYSKDCAIETATTESKSDLEYQHV